MSATTDLIDLLVANSLPLPAPAPKRPRNPYVTSYGKVIDQPKATAWDMEQVRQYRAAHPLPDFDPIRDMPRCRWYGQHREGAVGRCIDCGQSVRIHLNVQKEAAA